MLKRFRSFNILKLPLYTTWLARLFTVAKNPVAILKHYINQTSPDEIHLRNGLVLITSDQPHDIITFIVVFVKKDYGSIDRGALVVDVGANIGMFAVYAAHEGARKVHAFEPNPNSYETLKANIVHNKLSAVVMPHHLAVSGESGEKVAIPLSSSPYNQTVAIDKISTDGANFAQVDTISLNDFIRQEKIEKIDLLKMDCEGAEYDIFPSLEPKTISAIRSIRMEVHGDVDQLVSSLAVNPFRQDRLDVHGDLWLSQRTA